MSGALEQLINKQIKRWEIIKKEVETEGYTPVITISREPGSGGSIIGKKIAEMEGLDFFHKELITRLGESTKISSMILETLDEKGLSLIEEWISSLVNRHHLWPDQFLQHLMKVVGTIGKHGKAVIVGRGANFLLPSERCLKVRIIAPLEVRIRNVAKQFGVSQEEARKRIIRRESDRRAFVRKFFHADISSALNYDLIINTGPLGLEGGIRIIREAFVYKKGSIKK